MYVRLCEAQAWSTRDRQQVNISMRPRVKDVYKAVGSSSVVGEVLARHAGLELRERC